MLKNRTRGSAVSENYELKKTETRGSLISRI
jgi:hypothetical protein